ncbi:kynurenine formamidase [Bacillus sp. JCM 19046]|nr:kynurenine formamidase [Bacillus sp. JCM 19045]GAF19296.1 kynurenine formamidase [Bacillus sp. JCM 19046]
MSWIDITMPLSNTVAHWPGDTPFTYRLSATIAETGSVNIGSIEMSTHTGTHADAPFHYKEDGKKMHQLPLDRYIGDALVFEAIGAKKLDQSLLEQADLEGIERLLIKTKTTSDFFNFPEEIPYVTADGAAYLQKQGIQLLGVDSPSVDPLTSKELTGHHSLHQANILIIENLVLDHVKAGLYEFIALPLRIEQADGSPVRAVIRPLKRSVR